MKSRQFRLRTLLLSFVPIGLALAAINWAWREYDAGRPSTVRRRLESCADISILSLHHYVEEGYYSTVSVEIMFDEQPDRTLILSYPRVYPNGYMKNVNVYKIRDQEVWAGNTRSVDLGINVSVSVHRS